MIIAEPYAMRGATRSYLVTPAWTMAEKIKVHARIPMKNPAAMLLPNVATIPAPIAIHHPSWNGFVNPMERPSRKGDLPDIAHLPRRGGEAPIWRFLAFLTVEIARYSMRTPPNTKSRLLNVGVTNLASP